MRKRRISMERAAICLHRRRYTRDFNRMTGLDWTPRELFSASRAYVTPAMITAWRRAANRKRMGINSAVE